MAVIQKNLFEGKNLQPHEIIDNLEAMAYDKTVKTFTMEFDQEEKAQTKEQYFEALSQLDALESEFESQKLLYASKKKTLNLELQKAKVEIKNSGFETTEDVYMIDDQENNIMNFVDKRGNVIETRPLYRKEKQLSMKFSAAANS
ncbi:MAG: hypothetical protein RLZZ175_2792 [Bacteroidota bacterium]|jgi:hypothetical protein